MTTTVEEAEATLMLSRDHLKDYRPSTKGKKSPRVMAKQQMPTGPLQNSRLLSRETRQTSVVARG